MLDIGDRGFNSQSSIPHSFAVDHAAATRAMHWRYIWLGFVHQIHGLGTVCICISWLAKTIFAHCSKIKVTLTSRKSSLFVVIPCRYSFRARLSSCEVSLSLCVFCVFFFIVLFNFRLMLCCRFWRIKMNIFVKFHQFCILTSRLLWTNCFADMLWHCNSAGVCIRKSQQRGEGLNRPPEPVYEYQ